ncbi:MAG: recombination mediator RecR [Acidimicrobiia bacterium]|nr:recombination mediator RecR [Acidimicrobiia bacterium]
MFEPPVQRLIDEFARLPGVGQKSAQRLAFHLLNAEDADARRLADAIIEMKASVRLCRRCFNVTAEDECSICLDARRDPAIVCVVERAQDIPVIERTQEFRGRYHVLGGAISPIAGIGPETLRMKELVDRVETEGITEIIAATNPTVEGDTTALYIARLLKPLGVRVSRLASGLPVGGDLDYADEITLGRALAGRKEL